MLTVALLRARLHGLPDAGDGRLRRHRGDPQPRERHDPAADRRHDRARDEGRPRALPGRRHGRLPVQAAAPGRSSTPRSSAGSARPRRRPPSRGAPSPAGDPFEALVDEARMRVFRVDYPEIVDQLIELFVESTPPLLDELRAGAESGDGEAVRRAAHKLKGSCQNIGAGFMAKLAADLEQRRARPRRPSSTGSSASSRTRATRCAPRCWRGRLMDLAAARRSPPSRSSRPCSRAAPRPARASSERRYRALAAQWPDIAIALVDRDLRFALFEGDALAPHWAPIEVVGRRSPRSSRADRIEELLPAVEAALAGEPRPLEWVGVRSGTIFRDRRRPVPRDTAARSRTRCSRSATSARRRRCSTRSRSSAASSPPCSTQLGERVIGLRRRRRADRLRRAATPRARATCTRSSGPRHFGLRHPDGAAVRPARGAAAARAARRRGARRRDARRHARRHAGAAGQRRPGHDRRTAAGSAPSSSTPT